jgi:hypothetical protein
MLPRYVHLDNPPSGKALTARILIKPPSETRTVKGSVIAGKSGDIATSYVVQFPWTDNPETGLPVELAFITRSNITLKAFKSKGAPESRTLDVTYQPNDRPIAPQVFEAVIGGGIFYIKVGNIVIKGEIEGGPYDAQALVGVGIWAEVSSDNTKPSEVCSFLPRAVRK